jgi:Reverse transcriptase (RNA-dependent DNA polymerase)
MVYKLLGLRWHEQFVDCLQELGFFPSKAESNIWMRRSNNLYEYLGDYVDDLTIVSNDQQAIIAELADKYKFKLKGTGPIQFHLGMDFFRDADGILCNSAKKYIDKMVSSFERLFGTKPDQKVTLPLDKGDHPEFDRSKILDNDGIQKYQSLIGALQWATSIGHFDISTAVMTLSSFCAAPHHGHMDRVKQIYGYLAEMKDAAI